MNPDPLAGLRDWHLPGPIGWWPPAPGWWALAALILGGIGVMALLIRRRQRRGALWRSARRELTALKQALAQTGDGRHYVAGVSKLLRRLTLARYPRERVAGLSGEAWLELLDATGGEGGFAGGPGRLLVDAAYRQDPAATLDVSLAELDLLVSRWIDVNESERVQAW